jgi:cytochrome P450
LFLLAQHPKIATDVLDELDVLHGDAPTVNQISSLPLLERVIKESMRLFPPASALGRYSTDTYELGSYQLPKGNSVTISPYITHHMPEIYTYPDQFDPNRWSTLRPTPYEYLPFGAGPRACLGAPFAMQEMKIILAMALQRYRLTVVPQALINPHLRLTVSPQHGMPMYVVTQDRAFERASVRGTVHEVVNLIS